MDALRKAEVAKRQAGENPETTVLASALGEVCAAPAATAPRPRTISPDVAAHQGLALRLEALDTEPARLPPIATPTPPPPLPTRGDTPTAVAHGEAAERSAARNVFAAKHAPPVKIGMRLFLGLLSAALLGIGGYIGWQLQTLKPAAPYSAPPPASTLRLPDTPATHSPSAATPPPTPLAQPAPATAIAALGTSVTPWPPPQRAESSPAKPASPAAPPRTSATHQPATESPIQLSRSHAHLDPLLGRAYEALQGGFLDDARRDYEALLDGDPRNTDALLGLASIAGRQGEIEQAENYYARVLMFDPRNIEAQSAQLNLKAPSDPLLAESHLKNLLAVQPDAPALNFALGNLYARQNRWSEAQQAYFRASGAQPENADYLFNLAVSLEHLRQPRLAAQYYQTALNSAGIESIAFDRAQARRRIDELLP